MLKSLKDKEFNRDSFLQNRTGFPTVIENQVKKIINNIWKNSDKALIQYCKKFDKTDLAKTGFYTGKEKIKKAYNNVLKNDPFFIKTIEKIIKRIRAFHKNQVEKKFIHTKKSHEITGQLVTPIERVLIYMPGGNAIYPSTLLMNVIPARCAGVKNIYVTTPLKENKPIPDEILAVLYLLNIERVYHAGGAHAAAAFAYGTKKIPKVHKICGPGNIYVTMAKKLLYGTVDIDMIAGPSEVLIIADKKSNPEHIALDMLAQAEHDPMASSLLITDSIKLAGEVELKVKHLLKKYRSDIAKRSINKNGMVIIVNNINRAFEISNEIAPEHLEILLDSPIKYLPKIKNAGSIFLGEYTPVTVGDYFAGPNHTLPTMGTAKFYSQLGVYDFIKRTGFTYFSEKKLKESGKYIIKMAETEKLKYHRLSVKLR